MWQPPMMAGRVSYYPNRNWRQRGDARTYRRFRGNRYHWNHQNWQNCHQPFTGHRNEEQNYFGRMDTCGIPNRYQHENTWDNRDNVFMNAPAPDFHPIPRGRGFQREVPRRGQGRCQTPGPSDVGRPRIERMCRTPTPWNRQDDVIFRDVNEKFPPDLEMPPPTYKKRIQLDWRELEIPPPKYERRMHIDRSELEIPPPKRIQIDPEELDIPSLLSNERCQNNQLKEKELSKTVLLPNDKMRAQLEQEISTISASPEKRRITYSIKPENTETLVPTFDKRNLIRPSGQGNITTSEKKSLIGSCSLETIETSASTCDKKIQPEHGEQITKTRDLKSDCDEPRSNLIWNFSSNSSPDSLESDSDLELHQPGTPNITVIDATKENDNEINNEEGKQANNNLRTEVMMPNLEPSDDVTPGGSDELVERLVYYCKYCNTMSLDKDTVDMHVKTIYHFINYKIYPVTHRLLNST